MKRLIACLLIVSVVLPLSGCQVNLDSQKLSQSVGSAMDQAKEEVSGKIDEAVDNAKQEVSEKIDEAVDQAKDQAKTKWEEIWDKLCFWKKDTEDTAGKTQAENCPCAAYSLEKVTKDKLLTGEKEDSYVLRCEDCGKPYPVDQLKFSTFLQYYYRTSEAVSDRRKAKALDPYIRTKMLTGAGQEKEQDLTGVFVFIGGVLEKAGDLKDKIPVVNRESCFLFYNYLPVAFSDAGIQAPFLDVLGNVGAACDFLTLSGAAQTAKLSEERYTREKEKGVTNSYAARNAYIDYAISTASTLGALADFLGNFNLSVGVPQADMDALLKKVEDLAKTVDLQNNYEMLYGEDSIINWDDVITVNDVLEWLEVTEFVPPDERTGSSDAIYEAMKQGPAAREIAEAIPQILGRVPPREADIQQKLTSALWYYYGWRVTYEYDRFIDWIYEDEPMPFELYLKQ